MADINKCIDAAKEVLGFLDEDSLRNYVSDVLTRAKELPQKRGVGAIKQAQEDIENTTFNEFLRNYFTEVQSTVQNYKLFQEYSEGIKNGKYDLRDILNATNDERKLSVNVESVQRGEKNYLMNTFIKNLSMDDIKYLRKSANQMELAKAMFDESVDDPIAKRIGQAFKEYIDERNFRTVESHALPLEWVNNDRFLRTIHDATKMINGLFNKARLFRKNKSINMADVKQQWVNYIYDHLDVEKTFARTRANMGDGTIDEGAARDILAKTYDKIISGDSNVLEHNGILTDLDQKARRRRMFFIFKSPQHWLEYNAQYGHGTLYDALLSDINSSGSQIAMAQVMGTKASTMFNKLMKLQQERDTANGISHKDLYWRHTALMFQGLTGQFNRAGSPLLAQTTANLMQWSSMAQLGTIYAQSMTDANMAANWVSRWGETHWEKLGMPYFVSVGKQLATMLTQYTDPEKKRILRQFYFHLKAHGGYMGRYVDAQNMGDITSKMSNAFFTMAGMHLNDTAQKVGVIAQTEKALFQRSHLSFDKINPDAQKLLSKFEISPVEWDALRSKNMNGLFTMDNVDRITNDELKELRKSMPDKSLVDIRNGLRQKVFAMFDFASTMAILHPGNYEKALMYQGTKPGTGSGTLMRMLMQFKGFPAAYINRQLIGGYKNADGVTAKIGWATQQFLNILPLSFASTSIYYLLHGKSIPDPSQMNASEKYAFFAQLMLPSMGTFGMALDPNKQNSDLLSSIFKTPSIRLASEAASVPLSLAAANPKGAAKNTRDAFLQAFPLSNAPIVSPYLQSAFGKKPYLQPGQQQIYGGQ